MPWRPAADGVELTVKVTPRAGKSALAGVVADPHSRPTFHIRLAAPPVNGAANEALIAFLSAGLGLRKRDVTVRAGHGSRTKQVSLAGVPAELVQRLTRWIGPG